MDEGTYVLSFNSFFNKDEDMQLIIQTVSFRALLTNDVNLRNL